MSYYLLSTILPWFITFLIIVVLFIFVSMIPTLYKSARKIPNKYKLILLLTLVIGALLRFYFVPNFHRIYSDEDRYLSYAVSFARFNKTVSIDITTPQKIVMGIPDDAARTTVPVINGWVLKIFGYSENHLFQNAKLLSTLQILLIFILAYLLSKNYLVASFSAIGMALLPTNIYWSPSINLDTFAVTFAMLSLIAGLWYAREPNMRSSIFLVSTFFLLLGVRIESAIFLPVILLTIFSIRKDGKKTLFSRKELPYIILFVSLIAFRCLISISVIGQKWCCADALPLEIFAPNYFLRNLFPNVMHFITKAEFPFSISLLALMALIQEKGKVKLILVLWVLLYFMLYSSYYAGNFFYGDFSGSYGRYFLMLIPGMIILASITISRIINKYSQNKKMLLAICALIIIPFIPTALKYKTLISTSPYYNTVEIGPKILHDYLTNVILKNTPPNSVIIHTLTSHLLMENRSAVFIGYFFNKDEAIRFVEQSLKEHKKVYLFETHTCDIYPDRCVKIHKKFKFTPMNLKEGQNFGLDLAKVELK